MVMLLVSLLRALHKYGKLLHNASGSIGFGFHGAQTCELVMQLLLVSRRDGTILVLKGDQSTTATPKLPCPTGT